MTGPAPNPITEAGGSGGGGGGQCLQLRLCLTDLIPKVHVKDLKVSGRPDTGARERKRVVDRIKQEKNS